MTTAPGRRSRLPAPAVVAPVIEGAGWCVFTWYLFAQALAGPALIWNDSQVYVHMASHSLWSSGLWRGQRPPAAALLIKIVGSSGGFLAAQAVIGALAWGVLAWTVGRLVPPGWRRVAASWTILAFATAFPVTLWNRSVLSESLSMSLLALVFATLIWTARGVTWPRVAATTAACLCLAATRDAQVWTVAFLAVVVGAGAVLAARRRRRSAIRAGALALCLIAVVVLTAWGTISSHRTRQNVADVFYVRVFPFPGRVAWFADHGMPQPRQIDALAKATATVPGVAKVVAFPVTDPAFARLERWIDADGTATYLTWLVSHPGYVIAEPLVRPERSYDFANGQLTYYAASTDQLRSPLTVVMWPPLIGLGVLTGVAAVVSVVSGAWRQRAWRMVLALTVVGGLSMVVAWHGDGQEVTRHTVEGLAELRLGLWIMIVVGALGPTPTPRSVAPSGPEASAPHDGG